MSKSIDRSERQQPKPLAERSNVELLSLYGQLHFRICTNGGGSDEQQRAHAEAERILLARMDALAPTAAPEAPQPVEPDGWLLQADFGSGFDPLPAETYPHGFEPRKGHLFHSRREADEWAKLWEGRANALRLLPLYRRPPASRERTPDWWSG